MRYIWIYTLPLLSLVGSLYSLRMMLTASLIGWGCSLAGLLLLKADSSAVYFVAEFPTFAATTLIAYCLARRRLRDDNTTLNERDQQKTYKLRVRKNVAKKAVSKFDKEEKNSLIIYGLTKSLAESWSWTDMSKTLINGIQKTFLAQDFALFGLGQDQNWTLLLHKGDWGQAPPYPREIPPAPLFFGNPENAKAPFVYVVPVFTSTSSNRTINGLLVLKVDLKRNKDEDLIERGYEFGNYLGMALNKALHFRLLEHQTRIDGVTGLLRRRSFMPVFEKEFSRSKQYRFNSSLMMIDIDDFKHINDTFGHPAGDAVLGLIGQDLRASLQDTDIAGRYGGEEFIIMLPKSTPEESCEKAEIIRRRIEEETISMGSSQAKVTVSIGVSHSETGVQSINDFINQADNALLHAKKNGKNRIVEGAGPRT